MPRGSDRLLTFINNEERTHTHANTRFPPLHQPSSLLHLFFLPLPSTSPLLPCSSRPLRSSSFLYDELLGGFSVWQEALSLIQDEKKERKRMGEKKKTEKEGENLRPPGALLSTLWGFA